MNFERVNALNGTFNGALLVNPVSREDRRSGPSLKVILNNQGRMQTLNKTNDNRDNYVSSNNGQTEVVQEVKGVAVQYDIL